MIWHDHLCTLGNENFGVYSLFLKHIEFVNKCGNIESHAVAYDIDNVVIANARRKQMEHRLALVVYYGVTGVGAALKADNNVGFGGIHIGNFALTFIAPVCTNYCSYHFSSIL